VGKTAIVEALAWLIQSPHARPWLRGKRLIELSPMALVAGTHLRGALEERLDKLLQEAAGDPSVILFIDEVHTLLGAGRCDGGVSLGDALKPRLARGEIRLIGATTPKELRTILTSDPALERRLLPVRVEELSREESLQVLRQVSRTLERHHGLVIHPTSLTAALDLSIRYLPSRRLPDKAIDLLDQACAKTRLAEKHPVVSPEVVQHVLAEWAGIPVGTLQRSDVEALRDLEAELAKRVVGQPRAVSAVAARVRQARLGLSVPDRPAGSFLFVGPPGVGKTELAKSLAAQLGTGENLIRLDMSEFQEPSSINRLIGSPPGYVGSSQGGQLTEAIRQRPYSVVLFDEIEKAHPQVLDLLLQLLDEGRLTDASGLQADFRQAFVVLTSNLGVGQAPGGLGFTPHADDRQACDRRSLAAFLRPELLDRLDDVVRFDPLGDGVVRDLLDVTLGEARDRARRAGVELEVSSAAREHLLRLASSEGEGARALRRVVEREVVQRVAAWVLNQPLANPLRLDVVDQKLSLRRELPSRAVGLRASQRVA
jgi:ATP-dependent Clp protease ATP-binding subunit ClpC